MVNIVTADYVSSVVAGAGNISSAALSNLIAAASAMAQNYCRRQLVPNRWVEKYDAPSTGYLMLRQTPVLALNLVTLYPQSASPLTYNANQFDLQAGTGRISLLPDSTTAFPDFYFMGTQVDGGFPGLGRGIIQVDYTAGLGFLTTATASIAPGIQTVPLSATSGLAGEGNLLGLWQISVGTALTVDPGLLTQETITVTGVSATTITALFSQPHAGQAQLVGTLIPADLQLAVALIVGNLINQPDLTKSRESLGRTVGYEYFVRPGDLVLTPEIKAILGRYRDVLV